MKDNRFRAALAFGGTLAAAIVFILCGPHAGTVLAADKAGAGAVIGWDSQAAERYLDEREVWWQRWDRTQKDHGTYCISCHTQMPYGLARPMLLRQELHEPEAAGERAMLESIEKRVRMWDEVEPFYPDAKYGKGKGIESRNVEAVLNAVILSSYDAGWGEMSETTHKAFDNAWALQSKDGPAAGAWVWQNFHLTPWESPESEYHGAALMALAVGKAPERYAQDARIAANLDALRGYLRSHYDKQPLLNKVMALWASGWIKDALTEAQKDVLTGQLYQLQRADGGWSLTDLGTWARVDRTPLETRTDGYATALVALVLEEAVDRAPHTDARAEEHIRRGIAWLEANQDKNTGAWPAWSLNKKRDPASNAGPFMSDAATGFAVLALEGWPTHVEYKNPKYGFCFTLPGSWRGYSILNNQWGGSPAGMVGGRPISGPSLSIRHPAWTEDEPHADIPIMVFTVAQWELAEKKHYILSAAGVGPSEIGRNAHYVFALPARYFDIAAPGLEEVEDLIGNKALNATCSGSGKAERASVAH
jgi:hypothetical protein